MSTRRKPPSPHDALFKAAFGQADIASSELELVLPPEVRAHLDLTTLTVHSGSFVDEALKQSHADLLYAVPSRVSFWKSPEPREPKTL